MCVGNFHSSWTILDDKSVAMMHQVTKNKYEMIDSPRVYILSEIL